MRAAITPLEAIIRGTYRVGRAGDKGSWSWLGIHFEGMASYARACGAIADAKLLDAAAEQADARYLLAVVSPHLELDAVSA